MMTVLNLEFKTGMHYHDERYESENDHGLPHLVMRPVCIYSVFTTEASINQAEYKVTPCTILPFMPRWRRSLPFHEGVCQHLTINKMPPPMPEVESDDEEYLPTPCQDDPVWSEEPYRIAKSTYVSTGYPGQQPHPNNPIKECQKPHPHNLIK